MGRPTKSDKRDRQFNLRLTVRELEWVRARAVATGMQAADYGRAQLLAERPVRALRKALAAHLDPLLLAHLSRLGNNLNQIARALNSRRMPVPPDLGALLAAIREIIRKAAADGP
jgi:ABC-type transporter Mla subunit MlaD